MHDFRGDHTYFIYFVGNLKAIRDDTEMKFDATDIMALTTIGVIALGFLGLFLIHVHETHERHETSREILKTMSTLIENGQEEEAKKLANVLEKLK